MVVGHSEVQKKIKSEGNFEDRSIGKMSKNIEKLKKVLIDHLMQHKMLVKSAIPFDSSFASYQDAIETYQFGLEELTSNTRSRKFKRSVTSSSKESSRPLLAAAMNPNGDISTMK